MADTEVTPAPGQVWRHKKSGNGYFVIGVANAGNPLDDDNNPPIVEYMGRSGIKHARYLTRWHGSFELALSQL